MNGQLVLGTIIIIGCVLFHVSALLLLAAHLKRVSDINMKLPRFLRHLPVLGFSMLVIIGIHTVEAWGWAAVYMYLGEFDNIRDALYFSAVTSTTLGYGDLTLSEQWRILGSFEAMGGLILFGASTAFMLEVMRRLFDRILGAESGQQ